MHVNSVTRPLINTTKRIQASKNISPYERDKVQEICEEINLLKRETIEFNNNNQDKINVYNKIQKEELNAIQLYHFERIQKNKQVANRETILTKKELSKLSDQEQSFYKRHDQLVTNLKSKSSESLYTYNKLHTPKTPFVIVRVIENIEEVMTKNGIIEFLKGSQTIVREDDPAIANLIRLGHLKKVDQ
ncbi:hypothetical protein RclHR1_00830006 [Rhizophagus clarus]|uniref:DNA replication complex GINS protein PSF1 n=1 Tax=Rhizophagus clarus TaxID=94130 RepID=A0A2Z6SBI2_9GLOM|nr:hypothetical protein RclHR1_00830006 [Rhizophagus clarus]GES99702.1 subunit of the GINS complex [Rhizophagus clarus]